MTEIFTAKTVEEAKALAAQKFGKSAAEIKFEIIDEGSKGILGFGKKDAKVKATVEEKAAAAKEVKSEVKAKAAAPAAEKKEAPVKEEAVKEERASVIEEKAVAEAKAEETAAEGNFPDEEEDEYSIENFTLIEDEALINPKVKLAMDYITSVLKAMDIDVEFTVYQNETGAIINLESDNNGSIIGRRGETLDSIQYLCSIIANKGDKEYYRITIDCYGYRKKRRETLQQLATKVAKSVLRTGRSQPLEPMNPYERRVIHSAIAKIEGVSSRSVGDEPYRKIVISSNNPKKGGRRHDDRRRGGSNDRRGNRPQKNREPFEPKAIDLSTSFEKDYKKPKPEDSIEGGLYGKIEL